MNQSNDEWARTHLDEMSPPNAVGEKRFDERVARVLSANTQCPDVLWQTLRSDMTNRARPSQRFLRRIADRRVLTMLLAASILIVFSSAITAFILTMHQETSFSTKYTTSQDSDAMQAMVSHTTIDDAEDDTSLKPRQTKGTSKIEQRLASTQAALAQLKKERDLAMSERNEARTRLKELEKSLIYAQSESDTLRSDLALARRETTGDREGMRQTSGRLSINYDTNVAEPSGLSSQHESALYLPSPTSDLSDSAEKSQNENSPLIFDKSN